MHDRFEIRELLGAGGMGEVYRAHDSRLRRDVALKLLPPDFALDAERRARFERETQVLASLNHPNIAALYEVVSVPGSHFLVLELVEGETLAERIAGGAMPIPEALGIAAQIALALEAAHDKGIVHRDLKPANVKLRPDGTVKLLDFGLAKVFHADAGPAAAADVTLTAHDAPGAAAQRVLGSPAFMSPEQARGMPVDKRTDVWAFGCLLYEMLCGTRAFAGDRASDVIARILEREPDLAALPAQLPATIHRLLRRCLEKDPRQRLRDIGDARLELLDALGASGSSSEVSALVAKSSRRRRWLKARWLAVGGLAAAAGMLLWFNLKTATELPVQPVRRFSIADNSQSAGIAISADGSQVAYLTQQGLVVRALDQLQGRIAVPTNNLQGAPFFSPDGRWLGFKGWDALRMVPVTGGEVRTLVDRVFPVGSWSGKDIYFGDTRGLFRIPASGGQAEQLFATSVEQVVSVEVLAGRQAVLFTLIPTRGNVPGMAASMPSARIEALDLRNGKRHVVLRGGGRPRITSTGHLLYASGGTLYAIGFDRQRLQTRGAAVPVVVSDGLLDFDVSAEGTLFYQSVPSADDRQMVWVDRQGREKSLGAPARQYIYPRISPDGNRVALDVITGGVDRDAWIWDLNRETLELFTKDPAHNPLVVWSPDGSQLAFGSERSGVSNVYLQSADGSGEPRRVAPSGALQMPVSFAPDGNLLVSVGVAGQQRDIHLMRLDGTAEIKPLIQGPANELMAEVSPDSRWMVYDSDESGQFEVYVRPYPDPYAGRRWQVSSGGGGQPMWSRNGREIYFRNFDGDMIAVPVVPGNDFRPGKPVTLFHGGSYIGNGGRGGGRTYDVSADASRFLMLKGSMKQRPPELVVVINWFDELRRLAPLH
jgi:serine/threonine-protein kinase